MGYIRLSWTEFKENNQQHPLPEQQVPEDGFSASAVAVAKLSGREFIYLLILVSLRIWKDNSRSLPVYHPLQCHKPLNYSTFPGQE